MNNISIIGRMTAEPEVRYTTNNVAVCSFTLAVKRPRVRDTTDFLPCVVWRQGAEYLGKYAHKGSLVGAAGALTARKYEDREGNKRTVFEVLCSDVELLEKRSDAGDGNYTRESVKEQQGFEELGEEDGELPF